MDNFDRFVTDPSVHLDDLRRFTENTENIGKRYHNYLVSKTSGSTSEPLYVLLDQRFLNITTAESLFLGTLTAPPNCFILPKQLFVVPVCIVKDNIRRFPFIKKDYQILDTMWPMEKIVADLNRIQPKTLYTQPSIAELVAYEQEKGRLNIQLKGVVCNSEMLPEPTRKYIQKVFKCSVQSIYGCTEMGNVAIECSEHRHHLDSYWKIMELVDADYQPVKNGERSKRILMTNLGNRIMPFIRYEVSDQVIYHEGDLCPCGKSDPWIELEGRDEVSLVTMQKGSELVKVYIEDPRYMCTCKIDGLRRLQLAVHGYHEVECRCILEEDADQEAGKQAIVKIIQDYLVNYGITDPKVWMSELPPQLDARSRKMKDIYQDQLPEA